MLLHRKFKIIYRNLSLPMPSFLLPCEEFCGTRTASTPPLTHQSVCFMSVLYLYLYSSVTNHHMVSRLRYYGFISLLMYWPEGCVAQLSSLLGTLCEQDHQDTTWTEFLTGDSRGKSALMLLVAIRIQFLAMIRAPLAYSQHLLSALGHCSQFAFFPTCPLGCKVIKECRVFLLLQTPDLLCCD